MTGPLDPPIRFEDLSPGQRVYLTTTSTPATPAMGWGTDVLFDPVLEAVEAANRSGGALVSPVAYVIKAVARCLVAQPEMNVRLSGGRVRPFRGVRVDVSIQRRGGEAGTTGIRGAEAMDVGQIARSLWEGLLRERSRRPTHVQSVLSRSGLGRWIARSLADVASRRSSRGGRADAGAPVLVNYLGGREFPPMRTFVPSQVPVDYLLTTVTVGRPEPRPVVVDGAVVARTVAPVFVRSDHRLVDGRGLGRFVGRLKDLLEHPERLEG